MNTVEINDELEEQAVLLMDTVRFLYPDEEYPHDAETVRAMLVLGGSPQQIRESIAIAAVNVNVNRESKSRYAFGVLRNLMNPRPLPVRDWQDDEPDDDGEFDDMSDPEPSPRRRRRWFGGGGFDPQVHG